MMDICLRIFCGVLISVGVYVVEGVYMRSEKDLLTHLLGDYNSAARPVRAASSNISIWTCSLLKKLQKLNEQDEMLETNIVFMLSWRDEYLTWDVADTDGVTSLPLPASAIWTPILSLSNSAGDKMDEEMTLRHTSAIVSPDGRVEVNAVKRLKTRCNVNLRHFPFDTQTCEVIVMPGHTNNYYRISATPRCSADMRLLEVNTEWRSVSLRQEVTQLWVDDAGTLAYDEARLVITMERNPTFYVIYLVIPSVLMACVSVLVFLLPPESGERVGLSITVLLSYTVFLLMVSEIIPRGGTNTCLLVIYITIVQCLAGVNLALSILVLKIYNRKRKHPVPQWVARAFSRRTPGKVTDVKPDSAGEEGNPWHEVAARCDWFLFYLNMSFVSVATLACVLVSL